MDNYITKTQQYRKKSEENRRAKEKRVVFDVSNELYDNLKDAILLSGKTQKQWLIEAIEEKIKKESI